MKFFLAMLRESRGSRGRLIFFMGCIAVGVAAVVGVAFAVYGLARLGARLTLGALRRAVSAVTGTARQAGSALRILRARISHTLPGSGRQPPLPYEP